jgi:hypothetical protein
VSNLALTRGHVTYRWYSPGELKLKRSLNSKEGRWRRREDGDGWAAHTHQGYIKLFRVRCISDTICFQWCHMTLLNYTSELQHWASQHWESQREHTLRLLPTTRHHSIPNSGDLRPLWCSQPPRRPPQGPGWWPSPGVVCLGRPLSCRPVSLVCSLDHAWLRCPTTSAALAHILIWCPPPSAYHLPLPASLMLAP